MKPAIAAIGQGGARLSAPWRAKESRWASSTSRVPICGSCEHAVEVIADSLFEAAPKDLECFKRTKAIPRGQAAVSIHLLRPVEAARRRFLF
jgi:hypothetical protein